MIVPILLMVLITYIAYPIILGFKDVMYVDFILEVKEFSSVYYTFGMHFLEHTTEDPEYVEQEFTIALYIISMSLVFYKRKEDA